jgi:hypothetical protein
LTYGTEVVIPYGGVSDYGKNFVLRKLGYVPDWFGIKLRGATKSRMNFCRAVFNYG